MRPEAKAVPLIGHELKGEMIEESRALGTYWADVTVILRHCATDFMTSSVQALIILWYREVKTVCYGISKKLGFFLRINQVDDL